MTDSAKSHWGPFADPAFRFLFAGRAISSLGDRIVPVVLAFAVLEHTGSTSALGIVLAAQTVPYVMLVLFGGVWADRLPRRRLMQMSDAVRFTSQGLTAFLLFNGSADVGKLAVLQAIYGTGESFFSPAATGLVADIVDARNRQQANAAIGLMESASAIVGPALGGVLVATAGSAWGLAADAGTFAVSGVLLAFVRVPATAIRPDERKGSAVADLRQGWRAFRSRTWVWVSVLALAIGLAFAYAPFQVLGPEVARESLGGPGAWAGISAVLAVGAFLGGILGLRWRPTHPLRVGFSAMMVGGPALLFFLGSAAALPLILVAALIQGASQTFFNALWFTALQRDVPHQELSRVSSWDYLGSSVLRPIGLAASGPIAVLIGVSATLYGAGFVFLLLLVGVLSVPAIRHYRS